MDLGKRKGLSALTALLGTGPRPAKGKQGLDVFQIQTLSQSGQDFAQIAVNYKYL